MLIKNTNYKIKNKYFLICPSWQIKKYLFLILCKSENCIL